MSYPPLTSLDDMPLHGGRLDDARPRFACQNRQLHFDYVQFDWRCPDCVQAAIGFAEVGYANREMRWVPRNGEPAQSVTLQWNIERAVYWSSPAAAQPETP